MESPPREKGRRKPANTKAAKPPAATKKRGAAANRNSQLVGQKLITEVLKPTENLGISPEKKVRRMRPSPFNKKSGSVLGKLSQKEDNKVSLENEEQESPASASASGSTEEMAQFVAPRARPQRGGGKRGKAVYVLSETESDEVSDDSDFNEDDE